MTYNRRTYNDSIQTSSYVRIQKRPLQETAVKVVQDLWTNPLAGQPIESFTSSKSRSLYIYHATDIEQITHLTVVVFANSLVDCHLYGKTLTSQT